MKLNQDCVRELMLELEDILEFDNGISYEKVEELKITSDYPYETIIYTIKKLNEAGYIKAKFFYADNSLYNLSIDDITWEGHKFLDNIRDNFVWKKTKSITSKFSSVSFNVISEVASNVILNLIKSNL